MTKDFNLKEFHEISDECLLHYALMQFDKFNRFMYCLKNKHKGIVGFELAFSLAILKHKKLYGIPKEARQLFSMLCIRDKNKQVYHIKYNSKSAKTRKKLDKLIDLLYEHLQLEFSTLNKTSTQAEIITTLIARDVWRMHLSVKYEDKICNLMHIDSEISKPYFGQISPYHLEVTNTSNLTHIIKVINDDNELCSYPQIYKQVLAFIKECEDLNLPLVYNYSNVFIPITGLVNQEEEEEESDYF